ncbi:MAG TPA: hypothetical protein VFE37_19310 [Chloroflexota bacterium]|nr:hypothetical protein [Chloroflexota bacterium]
MSEQPPSPPTDDAPETIEVLAAAFQEWKRDHPGGTWRDFWAAVAAGEAKMPS